MFCRVCVVWRYTPFLLILKQRHIVPIPFIHTKLKVPIVIRALEHMRLLQIQQKKHEVAEMAKNILLLTNRRHFTPCMYSQETIPGCTIHVLCSWENNMQWKEPSYQFECGTYKLLVRNGTCRLWQCCGVRGVKSNSCNLNTTNTGKEHDLCNFTL